MQFHEIFVFFHLDYVFNFVTGWTIIGPYLIGFIPRFVMLLLSFISDYTTYQICILYKANFNQCLTTLASSYVMLIYSTRTFSNSIEMVRKKYFNEKIMCIFKSFKICNNKFSGAGLNIILYGWTLFEKNFRNSISSCNGSW